MDAARDRPADGNRRVREYRQRMRDQGMRPIQIWVIDTRDPGFVLEAHRQSQAVASSAHAEDDQAFIDALSIDVDEEI